MIDNDELDQLAFQFFKLFARSEYALKAAGFYRTRHDNNAAEASWPRFSREVERLVRQPETEELRKAIDYLAKNPPKQQVITNNQIAWQDEPPRDALNAHELLIFVRRVRNNLFHGGKFNGNWFEPERSEKLIQHSIIILKACIDYVGSTREAYNSPML